MIELPKSTYLGRFLPKEKFYKKATISHKLRQLFTYEIERITWINKISSSTLNITSENYEELQVFEIKLKVRDVSQAILKHIDTYIPYPILFVLTHDDLYKAVMAFKKNNVRNQNMMNVDDYYQTDWKQSLDLRLKGRSVDEIYTNFLYQIEPSLKTKNVQDAEHAVTQNKERQKIQKQIDLLHKKIINEPAIAKRQDLARQRYELEMSLDKLT